MNYVDILLLGFFGLGGYFGFKRGFIVEVLSLIAFFLGLFLAVEFTEDFALKFFSDNAYFNLISVGIFFGIFIVLIISVNLIATSIKKILALTPFSILDNILGALLNLLKLALIFSVIFWIFDSLGIAFEHEQVKNSVILNFIIPIGPKVFETIGSFIPYFDAIFEKFDMLKKHETLVLLG